MPATTRLGSTINSPTPTERFAVGQQITLTGSATDPEDGPLAAQRSQLARRAPPQHAYAPVPASHDGQQRAGHRPAAGGPGGGHEQLPRHLPHGHRLTRAEQDRDADDGSEEGRPHLRDHPDRLRASRSRAARSRRRRPSPRGRAGSSRSTLPTRRTPTRCRGASSPGRMAARRAHDRHAANPADATRPTFSRVDYPRPGGATPLRVPLVPAFSACTNSEQHARAAAGLPVLHTTGAESPLLTTSSVGAGSGSARFDVIAGDPRHAGRRGRRRDRGRGDGRAPRERRRRLHRQGAAVHA